jgi:hypothetical protein
MGFLARQALLLVLLAAVPDPHILRKLAAIQARLSAEQNAEPAYVVFDRWPRGKPRTIFAVLPNGEGAGRELVAFRVSTVGALRRVANFGSEVRSVELRDVTGDGIPEALVTLPPGNRSAPVEILQWDERQFHELGETNDSAEFIDLDHDGIPEIVERAAGKTNSCDGVTGMTFMQRFVKGKFTDATPPNLADIFTYTKVGNAPEDVEADWIVSDTSPTTYRLRVIDVRGSKVHQVKGIDLRLRDMNGGGDMAPPVRIELSDAEYDTIVNLPSRCTVASITVRGPANAVVALVLESDAVRIRR